MAAGNGGPGGELGGDYTLPQNLDAELSVLGASMLTPNVIPAVSEIIRPHYFYRPGHQRIFEVIEDLFSRGEPVDPITVSEQMANRASLEAVGGRAFIHSLVTAVPAATNARYYAEIVKENYYLRSLIKVGGEITEMGYRREKSPTELIDRAEQMVFSISESRVAGEFEPIGELITESFSELERLMSEGHRSTGCQTGFRDVDTMVGGFQPGNLTILAARPAMGKTAFALNIARNVAVDQRQGVAIFSLEMSKAEVVNRMMCSEARVDSWRVRRGALQPRDWSQLAQACTPLHTAPIFIDDTASVTLMEIRAKARRLKAQEKGLGLIVVDYLQLMMGDMNSENRQQEVSRISRGLKILARELEVPVLALSQLSRQVEQRAGNKPVLSDLRESGSLEQDADIVMFIYRDEVYNRDSPDKGTAEIIIGKQRNGPIGECKMAFMSNYTRFADMADTRLTPPRVNAYDVIIVGGGPAGIFAALELAAKPGLRVLLLEKGADISERRCPARDTGSCVHCPTCDITTGWGGAGAFSDGKLTLGQDVGGWLGDYVDEDGLRGLISDVDGIWRRFGAPDRLYGHEGDRYDHWADLAARQGLRLVRSPVRHLGTERSAEILAAMRADLEGKIDICTDTSVATILALDGAPPRKRAAAGHGQPMAKPYSRGPRAGDTGTTTEDLGRVAGVVTADGTTYKSPVVIAAPGREGSAWLTAEAARLGIDLVSNAVDIGVRVEVPAVVTDIITDELYEPKLLYTSRHFEDQVRTFCMNPRGVVCTECWGDAVTVNGHSYANAEHKTANTNFALLVSTRFTVPFKEPIEYGKSVARLANMLGRDILVQRLGDLRNGHRTTAERLRRGVVQPTLSAATPGDLSFALPYRHLRDLVDMLDAMDALLPGVGGRDTLLYGAEVKFYSSRLTLGPDLQTPVHGLYAIGDGAGVTRGLVQASASGLVAARATRAARG